MNSNLLKASLWIALTFTTLVTSAAEQNLLKNADFTQTRTDGKPAPQDWYVEGNCALTISKTDGLEVRVKAAGKKDGRLAQSLDVAPQSTYVVTAEIKGSVSQMAYLQIEFLNGGLEIKTMPRLDSAKGGTDWTPVTLKIATQDAKRFSVMCRFEQSERTVGQTASFRNLRLIQE
jgi:hypothetical protein